MEEKLHSKIVNPDEFQASDLNLEYTPEMIEDLKNFNLDLSGAITSADGKIIGLTGKSNLPKLMEEHRKQKIENIAWEVFQLKLGLSFKSTFTSEDKKKVTEVEAYEYYREEATKIYEKKQLALLNKKYPVIDVPANGKSGWFGGAYVLCFVYSKYKGNFVLRGYSKEVDEYLKKNYTHYFYYKSYWYHGFSRGHWDFWKDSICIFEPDRKRRKEKKFMVRPYNHDFTGTGFSKEELDAKTLKFKRLPKRWIPEFDIY